MKVAVASGSMGNSQDFVQEFWCGWNLQSRIGGIAEHYYNGPQMRRAAVSKDGARFIRSSWIRWDASGLGLRTNEGVALKISKTLARRENAWLFPEAAADYGSYWY